jgi:hypothetical protein
LGFVKLYDTINTLSEIDEWFSYFYIVAR